MKHKQLAFLVVFLLSLSFVHASASMVTSTLTATNYNRTLVGSANATESLSVNVTYFYALFLNGTLVQNGTGAGYGSYVPNMTRNFVNITLDSVNDDGTYILQVIATNGTANSSALNSSGLVVTFPRAPEEIAGSRLFAFLPLVFFLAVAFSMLGAYTEIEELKYALYGMAGLFIIVLILSTF